MLEKILEKAFILFLIGYYLKTRVEKVIVRIKGKNLERLALKGLIILLFLSIPNLISTKSYIARPYLQNKKYQTLKKQYKWLTTKKFQIIEDEVIRQKAWKYKINTKFICALIQYESNGVSTAISRSGARGMCQIMPFHHPKNPKALYNDKLNVQKGVWYLKLCMKKARYNRAEALRMYNSGLYAKRHRYRNWKYVKNILRAFYKSNKNFKLIAKL